MEGRRNNALGVVFAVLDDRYSWRCSITIALMTGGELTGDNDIGSGERGASFVPRVGNSI
jgi:hypothetical protein